MATVSLYFSWVMFRPDQRTYRQNSIELFPRTRLITPADAGNIDYTPPQIKVDVPLQHDFIANCEAIITAQMSGEIAPEPVLTLAGMRNVQDQFDARGYATEAEEVKLKVTEGEWGNEAVWTGSSDGGNPPAGPAGDNEWAEATTQSGDAPWDDSKEDWGK